MNVHLIWFGQLRDAAGVAEESVAAVPGATVASVLVDTAAAHGERLRGLLLADGAVAPTILVSMNDVQVTDASATEVTDGASLVVMTPISGG